MLAYLRQAPSIDSLMRLRRLETYGFKSFADRLTFDFEEGITAIIGPNGCGKSNVVDSIKWVIGEQSAKALRGEDMTDVIFNGCATRKSMPFCEVTLVMDQLQHALPGIDTDEVAITRRLFRDGVSAYHLNGKSCRLKDIKEIFLGTGMGTSAYAVIEQGKVGFILESNTKDRRLILEEAAGISRYKVRRRLAARKLERVETDLQRIGEVLNEVRRRVKSVAKQAATALRFKELSSLVQELRLGFALEEFGRLSEEHTKHHLMSESLTLAMAEGAARLGELEAALAEADVRLVTLEGDVRDIGEQRAAAQSRRDVADHKAKDSAYRLKELDSHEGEDRQILSTIAAKIEALAAEHAHAERDLAHLIAETGASIDDGIPHGPTPLSVTREHLDAVLAEVDALVQQAENAKAKQIECFKELARIEAEQGRLESAKQATSDRRKRLEDRTGGQASQLMDANAAEIAAKQVLEQSLMGAADAHRGLDDRIRARETALAQASQLDQELNEIGHQAARSETSLRLYRDQEHRAEGLQRGVRDVLQMMGKQPGIVGMVADLCRIPDEDVVAIETALGAQAQNIITETQDDAKSAIDFLKRERRGRATFLPLDDIRGGERIEHQLLREPGVIGIASRLIEFEPRLRGAFEYLLGNVLIVENIDDGIALRRRHRPGCRIVTRDGDIINAGGAMTGGRQQGQESGGVVSRKHEIAKIADQLAELTTKREQLGLNRDAKKKEAFELSLAVEECRRQIQAGDRAVGEAKAQLMKAERDRLHFEESASGFGAELEEIASELGKLESEGRDLLGQHEWFTALQRNLTHDLESRQSSISAKGARRDQLQDEVNTLRVSAATVAERVEAARNHLGHLTRSLQNLEDQRDERTRRLDGLELKRTELRQILDESAQVFANEAGQVTELAKQLDAAIKERDAIRNGVEDQRQEARVLNARAKATDKERQEAALLAHEAKIRIENLTTQILESHQIDLAEAFGNYERPGDLDLDALREQLHDTESELKSLGPVNLAAIDELEEVQARQDFLDKQFNDLTRAMETLGKTIEDLNRICGQMFEATYKQVRANFQLLFRKLFSGGRADLELEKKDEQGNPVDPLEAGLEIVACPPGKNPKIITQLSGGEKALTAIALLFAVYQTKPSPFCILDEVDAPLDDANVDVYNAMIREFTKQKDDGGRGSQFIVITHKKRTMQKADAVYGITQNEPGVSTKISVKFEDIEAGLAALTEAGGAGELQPTVRGSGPFAG